MGTTAYGGKGQGKGKGRGEGRLGQGGRGRSQGGERPMGTTAYGGRGSKRRAANGDRPVGAASCRREPYTMASCQNPPTEAGMIHSKPHRGCRIQGPGTHGYRRWKTADFLHSAGTAHGAPPASALHPRIPHALTPPIIPRNAINAIIPAPLGPSLARPQRRQG